MSLNGNDKSFQWITSMTILTPILEKLFKLKKNQYFTLMMSKKKGGRFNGLSEEEVKKRDFLPDYLQHNLDIVIIGINPSLMAAFKGRYYAGPGNHFYKLLHASGLVPQFVSFEEDHELLKYNIGLTNIVDRATRSSADLTASEIRKGCDRVVQKLKLYKPKIAVFNGKCIYQVYAQQIGKSNFDFGLQFEKIGDTAVWVVPSSSARCSNFPRMVDKLHFYEAIKKHLRFLKGEDENIDIKQFYSMGNGIVRKPSDKKLNSDCQKVKSKENRKGNRSFSIEEYPQYVIAEILDGCQKSDVKENKNSDESDQDNEEGRDGKNKEGEGENHAKKDQVNNESEEEEDNIENKKEKKENAEGDKQAKEDNDDENKDYFKAEKRESKTDEDDPNNKKTEQYKLNTKRSSSMTFNSSKQSPTKLPPEIHQPKLITNQNNDEITEESEPQENNDKSSSPTKDANETGDKRNLKRCWNSKTQVDNDTNENSHVNFMTLIKQRLLEKSECSENAEHDSKVSEKQKKIKKLNFSKLKNSSKARGSSKK